MPDKQKSSELLMTFDNRISCGLPLSQLDYVPEKIYGCLKIRWPDNSNDQHEYFLTPTVSDWGSRVYIAADKCNYIKE